MPRSPGGRDAHPEVRREFNKKVTNRVTAPFARHLPGFAIVTHLGRRSGRTYRTPVNVFRRSDDYVFPLTYGADVDWVKNVEAAGACDIESRGRTIHLVKPQRFTDPTRRDVPAPVRAVLRLIEVHEFMVMHTHLNARARQREFACSAAIASLRLTTGINCIEPGSKWDSCSA